MNSNNFEKTIVHCLEKNHNEAGSKVFLTWFNIHGKETAQLTFTELRNQSLSIAGLLEKKYDVKKGDRVVIMLPPGLKFYSAFMGCLYLGAVPVPIYPPVPGSFDRDLPKIAPIVIDSGCKIILTNSIFKYAFQLYRLIKKLPWLKDIRLATLKLDDKPIEFREINPQDLAFVQYTSGSTSDSKGVMVTHEILMAQVKMVQQSLNADASIICVSWLPPYHDYGLCGTFLNSLFWQSQINLFSPITFLKNPLLWFKLVAQTKATHIAGPNFAYSLCLRKWTKEIGNLDFSSLKYMQSGAEPIQMSVINEFLNKFNIPKSKFYPSYGLAEHVIYVCDKVPSDPLEVVNEKVSCGTPRFGVEVKIINPETIQECKEGEEGEIWIHSPSVTAGYWNKPELTKEVFQAHLEDSSKNYLKTGDLGYLLKNKLFISGRLKDLIIIAGRNYHPQDLEHTIESRVTQIRPGCLAVFSIHVQISESSNETEEKIILVAELRKKFESKTNFKELANSIYQTVLNEIQLPIYSIVFLQEKKIPKTTSGKIRRRECKQRFLNKSFSKVLYTENFAEEK